jgi:hypothetical protein
MFWLGQTLEQELQPTHLLKSTLIIFYPHVPQP